MRQVPSGYLLLTDARILRPRIVSRETRVTLAHSRCRLSGCAVGWAGHAGSDVGWIGLEGSRGAGWVVGVCATCAINLITYLVPTPCSATLQTMGAWYVPYPMVLTNVIYLQLYTHLLTNREDMTDWFGMYGRHLIIRQSPHLKTQRDTISHKQTVPNYCNSAVASLWVQ